MTFHPITWPEEETCERLVAVKGRHGSSWRTKRNDREQPRVQKLSSGNSTWRKKLSGYRKTSTNTARVSAVMINCFLIRRRECLPVPWKKITITCRQMPSVGYFDEDFFSFDGYFINPYVACKLCIAEFTIFLYHIFKWKNKRMNFFLLM